jgi:hypothetical protein
MISRQRGWIGLVVILLALVIVAVLAQTALKRYGMVGDERTVSKSAGPRGVGPTAPVGIDATGATPAPGNAVERARGLESSLQQQTQKMGEQIDSQAK